MMRRIVSLVILCVAIIGVSAASAQSDDAERRDTRTRLNALLSSYGSTVNMSFHQAVKNEWNFIGTLTEGVKNADSFEVVIGVTTDKTISILAYPHYKGAYINIDKVRNPAGLLRKMVNLSYHNFLPWAADDTGDVVARFQFTLESGFPVEAIQVVLRSIKLLDQFVGQMRPDIDGSSAQ